jgi:threonine dehydratase
MSRPSSLSILAVLAASGALIAGCSSSSSSSSSAPTASATAATTSASAPASATSASASATSTTANSSTKPSAADCVTINKISSGVVAVLAPLQTESTAKADAALQGYISLLTTQQATLTSPAGKAALGSFITAFKKAQTEPESQATTTVTTAIGNLAAECA